MSEVMGPDNAQNKNAEFECLVNRHQEALLRMCYLHLKDRTMAEDAVQETFLKAYRSMDGFRGESSEKTWLMRIAINTCWDMNRSSWLRFMDRSRTPEMLPEASVPFREDERELVTAISLLPRKNREAFLLYYYQGMNTIEIAKTLGTAQSTVSARLKRAREKLRKELKGRMENE